jgi:hypothetical protein
VIAFVQELDAWERTAPRRLLDEILELKNHVAALRAEVSSLKVEKKLADLEKSGPQRRSVARS